MLLKRPSTGNTTVKNTPAVWASPKPVSADQKSRFSQSCSALSPWPHPELTGSTALQNSATYERHGAGPRFPWVALTHFLSIRTPFNRHRAHLGKTRTCRLAGRDVSPPSNGVLTCAAPVRPATATYIMISLDDTGNTERRPSASTPARAARTRQRLCATASCT